MENQDKSKQPQPAADESPAQSPVVSDSDTEEISDIEPLSLIDDSQKPPVHHRFWHWFADHKKWAIPGVALMLIGIIFLIPATRYKTAGLVLSKNQAVTVLDSVTNAPVSGASVSYGRGSTLTDANGKATLRALKVGHHSLSITKKYYRARNTDLLVPLLASKKTPSISLVATGRQVKIKINNYVDGTGLPGVSIKIAGASSKTDKDGQANVVVPSGSSEQKASLSLDGYNNAEVTVKVSEQRVELNSYKLVPTGRVYFFSNRSGKMDLMKANIDGSDLQVVLPGTGTETSQNSLISQSPDWKYVVLLVKRSSSDPTPQLYIVSTSDDKLLGVDTGNASFTIQGWAGDSLIYTQTRNDLPDGRVGKSKLKSYDANTGKSTLLDQSGGLIDGSSVAGESYGTVVVAGNTVIYSKNWYLSGPDTPAEQASLQTINADGQNHKQIASYDQSANNIYFSQHGPGSIYIWQQAKDQSSNTYYDYTVGGVPKLANIDDSQFYKYSQGYYPSTSGSKVLWTETRDGKNAFVVADSDGSNSSTIASFNDYLPYGWFTDKYILLTLSNNELYIMPSKGGTPLKITDYQPTNYFY